MKRFLRAMVQAIRFAAAVVLLSLGIMLAAAWAQAAVELVRSVVAPSAGSSNAGSVTLHYTMGQPLVGTVGDGDVELTSGFWSPRSSSATSVDPGATPIVKLRDRLGQNVPNPFNPATTVQYVVSAPGEVSISIFDVSGRRVATLVDRAHSAGSYTTTWRGVDEAGRAVGSGVYYYVMQSPSFRETRKMTLVR